MIGDVKVEEVETVLILTDRQLDEILALQLTIAWAGEGGCDPPRLGWWNTSLIPGNPEEMKSPPSWTILLLLRIVAQGFDEDARGTKIPDALTLYHLGDEAESQILSRLNHHRTQRHDPHAVLGPRFLIGKPFSKRTLTTLLTSFGSPKVSSGPLGRRLASVNAASPADLVPLFAAALVPLPAAYPLVYLDQGSAALG